MLNMEQRVAIKQSILAQPPYQHTPSLSLTQAFVHTHTHTHTHTLTIDEGGFDVRHGVKSGH